MAFRREPTRQPQASRRELLQSPAAQPARPARSGILHRCGATSCPPGACDHQLLRSAISRQLTAPPPSSGASRLVHAALESPGQALDAPTRAAMEPLFGHDFGHVRVHTDARAAAAARAVDAQAFTAGRDIVVGRGAWAPQSARGRRLLAHELTHVVQQGATASARPEALEVSNPHDPAELEAERLAGSIGQEGSPAPGSLADAGRPRPADPTAALLARAIRAEVQQTGQRLHLARQAPAYRQPISPPVEARPPIVELRQPIALRPPPEQIRYAPNPFEGAPPSGEVAADLPPELAEVRRQAAAALEQGKLAGETVPPEPERSALALELFGTGVPIWVRRAVVELERPVVTLRRGGTAPYFIETGPRVARTVRGQQIVFQPRLLHVLDAIEYHVGRAVTEEDLARVLVRYLGRTPLELPRPILFPALDPEAPIPPVFPPELDPAELTRRSVLAAALRARVAAVPDLARSPLATNYLAEYRPGGKPVEQREGPCRFREVLRGNTPHDRYAAQVTGSPFEVWISTPEGVWCKTDGIDRRGIAWEVKTGHEYFSDPMIARRLDDPRIQHGLDAMLEQRIRGLFVTTRCGIPYQWAFHLPHVALFARRAWSNVPPVWYYPDKELPRQ